MRYHYGQAITVARMIRTIITIGGTFLLLATAFATLVWWVGQQVEILSPMQHFASVAAAGPHRPVKRPDEKMPELPAGPVLFSQTAPTLLPAELTSPALEQILPGLAKMNPTPQMLPIPGQTLDTLFGSNTPLDITVPPVQQQDFAAASVDPAPPSRQVWVDNPSKLYYCPGERDYGHTGHGMYMTQITAMAAGNRASDSRRCP